MNWKSVERRLRTLKANGLAKLSPVNEDSDLVAQHAPNRYETFLLFTIYFQLSLFFRASICNNIGRNLSPEESNADRLKSEVEKDTTNTDTAVTLAHFKDMGFLYTEEGENNWVIFIARNSNSSVKVTEVQKDDVVLTWKASLPSDASIKAVTKIGTGQMNIQKSNCSLFVPSHNHSQRIPQRLRRVHTSLFCDFICFQIKF